MDIEKITYLKKFFEELYDENFKLRDKTRLVIFNKELEEFGISSKLTPKEIELKLQQIYEILEKKQEPLTKTTLDKDESEQLIKEVEKRDADIKETREKTVEDVERAQSRLKEIYAKSQAVQNELKDKEVYVKIEETEKVKLDSEEKKVLEEYKKEAIEHPEESSIKMAREIHARVDPILKEQGLPQEEIEAVVNKTTEKIVENLAVYDSPNYIPPAAHIAINNTVFEKIPAAISKNAQDVIKSSIATNNVYRFQPDLFFKDVAKTAFGNNFARVIFGADPNTYKISVSETPSPQYSYTYNFASSNESSIQILHEQNQTIENLKGLGRDEARNYLINQSATYFSKTAIGQKILSNSKAEIAFYSAFKGAGKTVTWTGGNFVGNAIIKFAPEYAPIVNLVTGTKFVTPVITKTATKIAGQIVGKTVGQVAIEVAVGTAAKTGVAATISATLSATFGTALPLVGHAIGAVVGYLFGKIIEKINWPKVKKFFSQYVLPVAVGGGLIMFGAPLAGLIAGGLLFGVARGATLAGIGVGMFNLFGFIGRSVGIAIATPVIVTLLIIPPLVAFIMLVINNSAYVVPPSFESGQGGYTPKECLGEPPPKPVASNIKYSSDGKYAFPTAPFEVPGYACYHWDGNKAADVFSPQNKPPMVAYESGKISNVTLNDSLGGKYIILQGTTSGRYYYYAHLCQVYVKSGDTVGVGDVIGTMDETGSGRVQHLHYAINEPPLSDKFIGGDGNVCPQKDFEEKFGFGICNSGNSCVSP